jgi:DNA-directed RNA polymerase specialized sigma24 family protein
LIFADCEYLLRDVALQVLRAATRRVRDFAAAEDAVHEVCSRQRFNDRS